MLSRRTLQPIGKSARPPALRRYSVALKRHLSSNVALKDSSMVQDEKKTLWQSTLPYVLFFLNIFVGSVTVFIAETVDKKLHDSRTRKRDALCISTHGFFGALFYVLSATSTIGYGVIYPCSVAGKVFGAVFSLLGIPLALRMLNDIGCKLYHLAIHLIVKYRYLKENSDAKKCQKRKSECNEPVKFGLTLDINRNSEESVPDDDSKMKIYDVPAWAGILLSLVSIFTCGMFYFIGEHYSFTESLYYSLLTFIAGDLVTSQFAFSLPIYFIIFLGFGMFSLTLHLVRGNIENSIKRIQRKAQVLIAKLRTGIENGEIEPEGVDIYEIVDNTIRESTDPFTRLFIPENVVTDFQEIFFETAFNVSRGTMADINILKQKRTVLKSSGSSQTVKSKRSIATLTEQHMNRTQTTASITDSLDTSETPTVTTEIMKSNSSCQVISKTSTECLITTFSKDVSCDPYIIEKSAVNVGPEKTFANSALQISVCLADVGTQTAPPRPPMPVKYEWEIFAARRRAEVRKARKARAASSASTQIAVRKGSDASIPPNGLQTSESTSSLQ